jgi:S1-C subfamily serine protease
MLMWEEALFADDPEPDASTPPPPASPAPRRQRRTRRGRWRRVVALAVALVIGLLVGSRVLNRQPAHVPTTNEIRATASTLVAAAINNLQAQPARSAQVYQTILPSMVFIHTTGVGGDSGNAGQGTGGIGTGVVVNADGSILTAFHVVNGADSIDVTFADGTNTAATVASSDPAKDIAVLKPDGVPQVVVPAVLGGGLRVGDDVYAVGHPLGLVDSLSAGVVSGLNRSIPTKSGTNLDGLIQFDAAVNPGNSGGPLLNRNGQVVGIVTALANPSEQGFFVGIAFAVPIASAGGGGGQIPPR